MKILTIRHFVLLLVLTLGAAGCADGNQYDLVGKWKYASWTMSERQVDLATLGTPIIDFNKDGTFKATLGENSSSEKWQLKGDTLSLIYSDGNTQLYYVDAINPDSIELVGGIGDMNTKLTLVKVK